MNRTLSTLGAITALAVLAPGAAATERVEHRGTEPEPSVELQLVIAPDGDYIKVNKFKFFDIPAQCDEGVLFITRSKALPAMAVNKRNRFGNTFDFPGAEEVKVRGKITDGGNGSRGTIRVRGNFTTDGVQYNNCDSGKVRWEAIS